MRFLFLNQYFPPDPAPTGILLRELADHLASRGHEVDFVSAQQVYRSAKKERCRLVRELRALWEIFWNGIKAKRPDVVISGTSPPLLVVIAALVARRHRARHAHWLFDMYPEIAIALGEIRSAALAQFFEKITRAAYRRTNLIVALDEDMAARLQRHDATRVEIIPPWVFKSLLSAPDPSTINNQLSTHTWLYSGNLGRAHEWQTLLDAQSLLEKRGSPWWLLFQGGGPSWPLAQARASELGLRHCEWKSYVPENELRESLLRADVLAVTQRPEVQGLLWPSKLANVLTLPRRILWVGPNDGAIARELRSFPQAGIFSPGQAAEIADWIENRSRADIAFHTRDASAMRAASLERWTMLLEKLQR